MSEPTQPFSISRVFRAPRPLVYQMHTDPLHLARWMGPAGANRDSRPDVREAQWPVLVHDIHNYTVLRADPTDRSLTVEFINAAGNRIANSRWSRTF